MRELLECIVLKGTNDKFCIEKAEIAKLVSGKANPSPALPQIADGAKLLDVFQYLRRTDVRQIYRDYLGSTCDLYDGYTDNDLNLAQSFLGMAAMEKVKAEAVKSDSGKKKPDVDANQVPVEKPATDANQVAVEEPEKQAPVTTPGTAAQSTQPNKKIPVADTAVKGEKTPKSKKTKQEKIVNESDLSKRAFLSLFDDAVIRGNREDSWNVTRMLGFLLSQKGLNLEDSIVTELKTILASSFDFYVEAIRHYLEKRDAEFFALENLARIEVPKTEKNAIRKHLVGSLAQGQHVTILGGYLDSAKFVEITNLGRVAKGENYYRVRIFNSTQYRDSHPIRRQCKLNDKGEEKNVTFLYNPIFEFVTNNLDQYNYFMYPDEESNNYSKIYPSFNAINYRDIDMVNLAILNLEKTSFGVWDYLRASLGVAKYTEVHTKILAHFYPQLKKLYEIPKAPKQLPPIEEAQKLLESGKAKKTVLNWFPTEPVTKLWQWCKALKGENHVDIAILGQLKAFEREIRLLPDGEDKNKASQSLGSLISGHFSNLAGCFPKLVKTQEKKKAPKAKQANKAAKSGEKPGVPPLKLPAPANADESVPLTPREPATQPTSTEKPTVQPTTNQTPISNQQVVESGASSEVPQDVPVVEATGDTGNAVGVAK